MSICLYSRECCWACTFTSFSKRQWTSVFRGLQPNSNNSYKQSPSGKQTFTFAHKHSITFEQTQHKHVQTRKITQESAVYIHCCSYKYTAVMLIRSHGRPAFLNLCGCLWRKWNYLSNWQGRLKENIRHCRSWKKQKCYRNGLGEAWQSRKKEKTERREEKHKGEGKEGETKTRRNQYRGDGSKGRERGHKSPKPILFVPLMHVCVCVHV